MARACALRGQGSPVRPVPGRGGVGGRVGTEGERETREEGRAGRVRSEVATDRFGSFKSLRLSWRAAACCAPKGSVRSRERTETTQQAAAADVVTAPRSERKGGREASTLQPGYQ